MMNKKTGFSYLKELFEQNSSKPFLYQFDSPTLSYGEFWDKAEQYAIRFAELGLSFNDRILIQLENSQNFLMLYLACAIGGYTACPIDPNMPEIRIKSVKDQLKPRYTCLDANQSEWTAPPTTKLKLTRELETGQESDFLIILSSGTTGTPKGIIQTVTSIVESARSFANLAEHDESTVVYHHFPMFYMAGVFNLFFCPAVAGSRIVLGPRFSPIQMFKFWEIPRKMGVNHLTLTPTMAMTLTEFYRTDDSLLEHIGRYQAFVSTGSALYDSVAERFQKTFSVPLRSCYGVTEVGGSITLQTWEEAMARDSVGRFSQEIRIIAGESAESAMELRVKTPFMMRGYLFNGEVVQGVDSEGFFHTGDLGYIRNGSLFLTGRENDLIKKGGEFVPLTMIEDLALRDHGILDAAAVAAPDDFWGNKIVLFYIPRPDQTLEEIERSLNDEFAKNLRKIEHPDKLIPVPRLPKTSIGKTIKRDLIKRYTI
ncbi:MAG: acyl--CoA ligase [Candidatus Riflebacteria bacterium]|nr:acyl--CoA ligase [Candidatus Riflebacteria bacterium]